MITNLLAILTSAAEEGTLGELTARPCARRRVASQPRHDGQGRCHHRRQRPARIRKHRSVIIRPRHAPTTQGSDPICTYLAVERGTDEEAKEGMRRRGAEGRGAAAARKPEAVRPRTAARKEREAEPRHAMAKIWSEGRGSGRLLCGGRTNGRMACGFRVLDKTCIVMGFLLGRRAQFRTL
jgi:hypothetical protein